MVLTREILLHVFGNETSVKNISKTKDVGMMLKDVRRDDNAKVQEQDAVYAGVAPPPLQLFLHVMIDACPSLAFAFMLLFISHAIFTGFACVYCILFLYVLALLSLHPLTL